MFSKADYVKYFLQVKKVETDMQAKFLAYTEAVDDPELKKYFARMAREEKAHSRIVDSMLETFDYKDGK